MIVHSVMIRAQPLPPIFIIAPLLAFLSSPSFGAAIQPLPDFPDHIKIISKKTSFLEPLPEAVTEQLNSDEKYSRESINIPEFPKFLSDSDAIVFFVGTLGTSESEAKEYVKTSFFPTFLWKRITPDQKKTVAKLQVRYSKVDATVDTGPAIVPLEELLPEKARRVLNRFPYGNPDVLPVKLSALYPDLYKPVPEEPFVYPQCYSATLWFYGLQSKPQVFLPREVLLGQKNIKEAQIEVFQAAGFQKLKIRNVSDLKFGDVFTYFGSHTYIYLTDNLIFEKPNGDEFSPWRITDEENVALDLSVPETVILRR